MPVVLVVGKFTSRGWAFYGALAFLHYVAIDLNPGANRTIGIPPFVGPLGYVMQPSNRGQHILPQECPNSLRHYFLQTSLFSCIFYALPNALPLAQFVYSAGRRIVVKDVLQRAKAKS